MTSHRSRGSLAALLAASAIGLAGCGTNFNAATGAQYQPGIGANQRDGDVGLYNAVLVQNEDGSFTLSVSLNNNTDEPQNLTDASFTPLSGSGQPTGEPVQAKPAVAVEVPSEDLLALGPAGEFAGLSIDGLGEGAYVDLVLSFAEAGKVQVEAPVVERTQMYDQIATEAPKTKREKARERAARRTEADGTAPESAEETQPETEQRGAGQPGQDGSPEDTTP